MRQIIKWIVFDLGGVVVKINPVEALEKLARLSNTDKNVIENFTLSRDDAGLSPNDKLRLGLIGNFDYITQLNNSLNSKLTDEEIIALQMQVIQGEDEEVIEIIAALSQQWKVACFSNTHGLHWDHMQAHYKSFKLFHHTIASHLIKAAKPDPKSFAIACRELDAVAGECILIDDTLENIEAARSFGWHAIHFKASSQLIEELRAYSIQYSAN